MVNGEKNLDKYRSFVRGLVAFSKGERPENLDKLVNKAWYIISQNPETAFSHDTAVPNFVGETLTGMHSLSKLRKRRITRSVNGAHREMTTESDAYEELQIVSDLLRKLVFNARVNSDFTNTLLNEAYNLSLAYMKTVTQACSDDYIELDDIFDAKTTASWLGKSAFNLARDFSANGFNNRKPKDAFTEFQHALKSTSSEYARDFELVFTKPKSMVNKERHLSTMVGLVDSSGFVPSFICPIAHGGLETGVVLDAHFSAKGYKVTNYPLMYSIKTRHHRKPHTRYDREFLSLLTGKKVLIGEDWVTTGNTLVGILQDIRGYSPSDVRVATIKRDPRSLENPKIANVDIYAGGSHPYKG